MSVQDEFCLASLQTPWKCCLYCNTNCCFSVFFCWFYGYASVISFSLFFHSQLFNCILDNSPYPMPQILITFPNFHFLSKFHGTLPNCDCLGTGSVLFPVLCFYVEGCTATIVQNCSSIWWFLIPCAKNCTLWLSVNRHVQKWQTVFVICCF